MTIPKEDAKMVADIRTAMENVLERFTKFDRDETPDEEVKLLLKDAQLALTLFVSGIVWVNDQRKAKREGSAQSESLKRLGLGHLADRLAEEV
jgi:hypothetical protein